MYKHRQIITSKQQNYILIQDAINVMYKGQIHLGFFKVKNHFQKS